GNLIRSRDRYTLVCRQPPFAHLPVQLDENRDLDRAALRENERVTQPDASAGLEVDQRDAQHAMRGVCNVPQPSSKLLLKYSLVGVLRVGAVWKRQQWRTQNEQPGQAGYEPGHLHVVSL